MNFWEFLDNNIAWVVVGVGLIIFLVVETVLRLNGTSLLN